MSKDIRTLRVLIKEYAEIWYKRGFNVIPLKKEKKSGKLIPMIEWHEFIKRRQTEEEFRSIKWERADGLAIVMPEYPINGYYVGVVDQDTHEGHPNRVTPEAEEKGKKVMSKMPITYFERSLHHGQHNFYRSKKPVKNENFLTEAGLELIGSKKLIIVYPTPGYEKMNDNPFTIVEDLNQIFYNALRSIGIDTYAHAETSIEEEVKNKAKMEYSEELLNKILEVLRPRIEEIKENKENKTGYITIHCPFHPPDNHPSFVIYKNSYIAVDFHESIGINKWKTYTLKELAQKLGIEYDETINKPFGRTIYERKKEISSKELINQIVETIFGNFHVRHFVANDVSLGLYIWKDNHFVKSEELIKSLIQRFYGYYGKGYNITTHIVNEVIEALKRLTYYELKNEELTIAFKNGILDWTDLLTDNVYLKSFEKFEEELTKEENEIMALREAIEEDEERDDSITTKIPTIKDVTPNSNIKLPLNYIPHELDVELLKMLIEQYKDVDTETEKRVIEELEPEIVNIFKQWVGDKWLILFEIIGYSLYTDYPLHKAFMFFGDTHTGKSTATRLINDIVGEKENAEHLSLNDIAERPFMRHKLMGKLVNTFPDLPKTRIRDTGYFKGLTGEDFITADIKHKEGVKFKSYAKHIYSTNQLPYVENIEDTAFFERWIVITFPNQFPENPYFYETTFTEEKIKRIIAISIWSCYLALKRKSFSIKNEDVRDLWLRDTEPIYDFLKTMIEQGALVEDVNGTIKAEDLYSMYVDFCQKKNEEYKIKHKRLIDTKEKRTFTITLQKFGIYEVMIDGYPYYKGLRKAEDKTQNLLQ
jgi:P4 family phage/plasmid primase-like protien